MLPQTKTVYLEFKPKLIMLITLSESSHSMPHILYIFQPIRESMNYKIHCSHDIGHIGWSLSEKNQNSTSIQYLKYVLNHLIRHVHDQDWIYVPRGMQLSPISSQYICTVTLSLINTCTTIQLQYITCDSCVALGQNERDLVMGLTWWALTIHCVLCLNE